MDGGLQVINMDNFSYNLGQKHILNVIDSYLEAYADGLENDFHSGILKSDDMSKRLKIIQDVQKYLKDIKATIKKSQENQ